MNGIVESLATSYARWRIWQEVERVMHELDTRKDQIMTICKVALANLVMWIRDRFFPATYAHATWLRLLPFFRLPGRVLWGREVVVVEVRSFNNRQLTRDLLAVCQWVNELQPKLPDGRLLILHAPPAHLAETLTGKVITNCQLCSYQKKEWIEASSMLFWYSYAK